MVSGCACGPGQAARSWAPGGGRAGPGSAYDPAAPRRRRRSCVLPAESRMRRSAEFELTVRRGSRARRALLTGYLLVREDAAAQAPLVGFVVSKAVGNAVARNKVRRRLRSVARGYLPALPGGSLLVVRAHPQAAAARQADLAAELDLVMGRLMRRQVGVLR